MDQGRTAVFVAENGAKIVYLSDMPLRHELLYSPDGQTFYVCVVRGFGGSTIDHDLSFEVPQLGKSGKLHLAGDVIKYDERRYTRQGPAPLLTTMHIVPLPFARIPEYLCKMEDGTFIYVSADRYNFTYESMRMFIGNGSTMREIPIKGVERYRDGGTTYIATMSGKTFYSPSCFPSEHLPNYPKWGDERVQTLNPDGFTIEETPEGVVTIKEK